MTIAAIPSDYLEYAPPPAQSIPSPTQVTQVTPVPPRAPGAVRARFVIKWHWDSRGTVLRLVRVSGLPAHARLTVRCLGRRCPRIRATASGRKPISRLLARLSRRRFLPGDRILLVVSAPGRRPERIALDIRRRRSPRARLLSA